MQTLSSTAQELIKGLSVTTAPDTQGEPMISVSRTVSAAAVIYEAARNAVEFRADHLIRRAAIERILKRRLVTSSDGAGIAESLIRELLWARYLENNRVPVRKEREVQKIIDKYVVFKDEVFKLEGIKEKAMVSQWILGVESCEIEECLKPSPAREALNSFVFRILKERILIPEEKDQKTHDIQVYLATQRSFASSDDAILRFRLFISFLPEWINLSSSEALDVAPKFLSIYQEIEQQLYHPLSDRLRRHIAKEVAPFNVIRDLANEYPLEFANLLNDEILLEKKCRLILIQRYQETASRLQRAAVRSIIYIFLTKMVLAFIVEMPYDYLTKNANYLALIINTLFPPALMFAVTSAIHIPGEENTVKILSKIKEYLYQSVSNKTTLEVQVSSRKPMLTMFFTLFYLLTYLLMFGGTIYFLRQLHFNIVSQGIFLFFLSIVSFFGYRVRRLTKDYEYAERERAFGPIIDFLFLPILRVGQWLSKELQQINVLIFVFDFIIEAPFKAFFYVIEEWISFVKIKREEITS